MAIQFKTEEQRQIDKEAKKPKTKLQKAHKVFFICSVVAAVILFLYFICCFSPNTVIAPLALFWLLIVFIPTGVTVGLVWTSEGYRNFVFDVAKMLVNVIGNMPKVVDVLLSSLIYVGPIALSIIATYAVLSYVTFYKNKEDKRYFKHFIASVILFALALIFVIVTAIVLPNVRS